MPTAKDAVSSLQDLLNAEDNLEARTEKLKKAKTPGTVIFFDLVGSTGYRRQHGQEKGLKKAYLHNVYVSRAIHEHGGKVVKWIGDGVMGCFSLDECGERHAYQAFHAALKALDTLAEVNKNKGSDDEIHTKIGLCAGAFHYFDVRRILSPVDNGARTDAILDPMGSEVDLAARLASLASMDVILIDANTFWGYEARIEGGAALGHIQGICKDERDSINWRKLEFPEVRETVYVPRSAGFFVEANGLGLSRVSRASSEPIEITQLRSLVDADAGVNGDRKRFLFASEPTPCNVRGFEKEVEAIAVSLSPHKAPIKEVVHVWEKDEIQRASKRAEKTFREGKAVHEALSQYQEVLAIDSRNFHANVRVAMIYRSRGDTTAAMKHLMIAKKSNPSCPLVWGVAGITHLDDFLNDRGDKTECLTRAITGLTRAMHLARFQFHGVVEQYAMSLLAVSLLLRGRPDDKNHAKALIDELRLWPAKNETARAIRMLAEIFFALSESTQSNDARDMLNNLSKGVQDGTILASTDVIDAVPYDHLIFRSDIRRMVAKANYLLEIRS